MNKLHKINGGGYSYLSPEIEVYSTVVEVGFAGTGELEYGDPDKPGASWNDDNPMTGI